MYCLSSADHGHFESLSVKVLAFDVYGTVFDLSPLAEAAGGLVPGAKSFVDMWRAKQLGYVFLLAAMGRYEKFRVVTEKALRCVEKRLGLSLGEGDRRRLMEAWTRLRPRPDAAEALQRLVRRCRPAALANGDRDMMETLLRSSGLRQHFAEIRQRTPASTSRTPASTSS